MIFPGCAFRRRGIFSWRTTTTNIVTTITTTTAAAGVRLLRHHDARPANAKSVRQGHCRQPARPKRAGVDFAGVAPAATLVACVPLQSLSELIGGHTVLRADRRADWVPDPPDLLHRAAALLLLMDLATVAMIRLAAMVISVPGVINARPGAQTVPVAQHACRLTPLAARRWCRYWDN